MSELLFLLVSLVVHVSPSKWQLVAEEDFIWMLIPLKLGWICMVQAMLCGVWIVFLNVWNMCDTTASLMIFSLCRIVIIVKACWILPMLIFIFIFNFLSLPTDFWSSQLDLYGSICFCDPLQGYLGLLFLCPRAHSEIWILGGTSRAGIRMLVLFVLFVYTYVENLSH